MDAKLLYAHLEKDFIKKGMTDDWAAYMNDVKDFLSKNFINRSMGVVCDNTIEINKVYTAVFPSKNVMNKIIRKDTKNALLFVHHPSIWDITKAPDVFYQMDRKKLEEFRNRNISIYNLHVPLDNFGKYSTSSTLANALDIKIEKPFLKYCGGLAGVYGHTKAKDLKELQKIYEKTLGHKVKLYRYGDNNIRDQKVAIIAGGGNDLDALTDISKEGVNTFITGITALNEHSRKAHEYAKKHQINILGGTHYSTETFACIAMCDYFKNLGLEAEFIKDKPVLEDM